MTRRVMKIKVNQALAVAAIGYYFFHQIKKSATLSGDDWMVNIDKEKILKKAEKRFGLNPHQRTLLEIVLNNFVEKQNEKNS